MDQYLIFHLIFGGYPPDMRCYASSMKYKYIGSLQQMYDAGHMSRSTSTLTVQLQHTVTLHASRSARTLTVCSYSTRLVNMHQEVQVHWQGIVTAHGCCTCIRKCKYIGSAQLQHTDAVHASGSASTLAVHSYSTRLLYMH